MHPPAADSGRQNAWQEAVETPPPVAPEPTVSEPDPLAESEKTGGKRGPKPILDEPTKRFEGQLLIPQHDAASALVTRLTMANRKVPAAERRRLTINTLVRVGMAVVLEHRDNLSGHTEQQILDALRASIAASASKGQQ